MFSISRWKLEKHDERINLLMRRHINNCTTRCMTNWKIFDLFREWLTHTTSAVQSRVSLIIRERFVSLNCQLTLVIIRSLFRGITGVINSTRKWTIRISLNSALYQEGGYVHLHFAHLTQAENLQQILSSFLATVFILKRNKSTRESLVICRNEKDRRINSSTTDRRCKSLLVVLVHKYL